MRIVKKIIFWGCLAAIGYVLLSFHFIYFGGTTVKLLKKSQLTLKYTFYSTKGKTNKLILSRDALREDGIADLLVEMGMMSEEERDMLLTKYQEEKY